MYADILSSVLNDWVDGLSGAELVEFAQSVSGPDARRIPPP